MAKVMIDLSMSLDGFITGPNPTPEDGLGKGGLPLHEWYFNGTEQSPHSEFFKPLGASRKVVDEMFETTGAMVVGRSWYDITNGWEGNHPIEGVPVFLVTHKAPEDIPQGKTPIHVVTESVETAVEQAKAAAGDKYATVGGASIAQQALNAGLVDEIMIHLVPILLGDGVRLFDNLDSAPLNMELIETIEAPGVTHLHYRINK
jgi:dihydrofolate reductase